MKSSGKNRVYTNDHGLVEIVVDGDQTVESVTKMADDAEALIQSLREKGESALILDNLMLIGKVPPAARKKVVERAKNIDYDKLAFVGNATALRLGANFILRAIGRGDKVKYFDDYGSAVVWLTNEKMK